MDPSSLTLNQTEVAPNQSIIISGSGFSEDSYVLVEKITIDGEPLVVDESGVEGVTSKGSRAGMLTCLPTDVRTR